jgi:ferrochelatase
VSDAGPPPRKRLAVVLFNLGGPDGPRAVRPFLRNLFSDKAIIGLPGAVRIPLASFIAAGRQRSATANYARMGGGSPILKETKGQADALQASLAAALPDHEPRVFIAMRYWQPMTEEAAAAVAAFAPDEVLLAPLYPQFSTTTTGSSLEAWTKAYDGPGRVRALCCYPLAADFIEAHAQAIRRAFEDAGSPPEMRLLFSAHGLPQRVVDAGDPYQSHVEATAQAVAERLGPEWDWRICYQSRVGPLKWLGPSTVDAMIEAAEEGLGVIVTPIAFVSEHIETLVELDHDYAAIAAAQGCPNYVRVPALGVSPAFIAALTNMLAERLAHDEPVRPEGVACQAGFAKCPYRAGRRH